MDLDYYSKNRPFFGIMFNWRDRSFWMCYDGNFLFYVSCKVKISNVNENLDGGWWGGAPGATKVVQEQNLNTFFSFQVTILTI